jgi:uncharacterized protein YgiM (DUF1202 family)
MKNIFYLLLIMPFIGCASTNKTSTIENIQSLPESLYIAVAKANVRQQPTTESRILTHLPIGTKVKVIQQYDNWFRIGFGEGKTGWVNNKVLSLVRI